MFRDLGAMCVTVSIAAACAVFFVRVEHDANRATWFQSQLFQQTNGFPGDDTTTAIVMCALAHVPRIEMSTDQDDLVRLFGTTQLCNHICRLSIRQKLRIHLESERRPIATIVHAL